MAELSPDKWERFEALYEKARESNLPADWMAAALMAPPLRCEVSDMERGIAPSDDDPMQPIIDKMLEIEKRYTPSHALPKPEECRLHGPECVSPRECGVSAPLEHCLKCFTLEQCEADGACLTGGKMPSDCAPSTTPQKPVDPESEEANPVWDLVIQTCAQAWPAGLLTWSQSPTELIVKIINERDEANQGWEAAENELARRAKVADETTASAIEQKPIEILREWVEAWDADDFFKESAAKDKAAKLIRRPDGGKQT